MTSGYSLTGKRWMLPQDTQSRTVPLAVSLARQRGIDVCTDREALLPPAVLHDMKRAVERIHSAIERGETIGIFGDYDCDGITATLQLLRFFRRRGIHPVVRLPHRVRDGYGIKDHIVDELLEKHVQLLITVDTGISSAQEIARAQEAGMDVIITDHHHVPEEVPPAYAIVHAVLSHAYPKPYPSGAGVVYFLLRALEEDFWEGQAEDRVLAMIGTIADVMELKGQNRLLVRQGLTALTALENTPLGNLIEHAGLHPATVTSRDVAFRLAPRINAAGRLADPDIALAALLHGGEALQSLEQLNDERQQLTETLFRQALQMLGLSPDDPPDRAPALLSVIHEDFPEGIVGLLAGRLSEMFGKPSIAVCVRGEECTASLRSVSGYHIAEGLTRCQDLLTYYGGHAQAAGCTFRTVHYSALVHRLTQDIHAHTKADDLVPTLTIDAVLSSHELTMQLHEDVRVLEPFGEANPEPAFLLQNVRIEQPRCVGSDHSHLQGRIAGKKCVGFRLGHLLEHLDHPVDIVCRTGVDTWNGRRELQIFVEDLRLAVKKEPGVRQA